MCSAAPELQGAGVVLPSWPTWQLCVPSEVLGHLRQRGQGFSLLLFCTDLGLPSKRAQRVAHREESGQDRQAPVWVAGEAAVGLAPRPALASTAPGLLVHCFSLSTSPPLSCWNSSVSCPHPEITSRGLCLSRWPPNSLDLGVPRAKFPSVISVPSAVALTPSGPS